MRQRRGKDTIEDMDELTAQRGWAGRADVPNALTARQLQAWLRKRRKAQ